MEKFSNTTMENVTDWSYHSFQLWTRFAIIWQSCASSVGILGNGSILLLVIFVKDLRKRFNVLLVNLAIANIVNLAVLPGFVVSFTEKGSNWTDDTIKTIVGLRIGSGTAFIVTLMALSIERYFVIVKPIHFHRRRYAGTCLCFCVTGIWVFGFFIALSCYLVVSKYGGVAPTYAIIFSLLFALYIGPLCCMVYCYCCCASVLLIRRREIQGDDITSSGGVSLRQHKRSVRLVLLLFTTTVVFAIAKIPSLVDFMWHHITQAQVERPDHVTLLYFACVVESLSQCAEPVIWFSMSTSFRRHLRQALCSCSSRSVSL